MNIENVKLYAIVEKSTGDVVGCACSRDVARQVKRDIVKELDYMSLTDFSIVLTTGTRGVR